MKVYDIVAVTGSYQDQSGDTKKRYKTVGSVMKNDNGSFLLIDKTFNPAGLISDPDRDSVILSLFEPREREAPKPAPQTPHPEAGGSKNPDEDIPF